MGLIKEAYKSAVKVKARTDNQTTTDKRTGITSLQNSGKGEYEGKTEDGTIIHITYDFDANVIDTAYPLKMNNNVKKH